MKKIKALLTVLFAICLSFVLIACKEKEPVITGIEVVQDGINTWEEHRENNLEELELTVKYSDGNDQKVPFTLDMILPEDLQYLSVVGRHEVTVKYLEFETKITFEVQEYSTPGIEYVLSFNKSYYTVAGYLGYDTIVTIPSRYEGVPVTKIADKAFYSNETIKKVIIPNTITSIGAMAFQYCKSMRSVYIPDSVEKIGNHAFYDTKVIYLEKEQKEDFEEQWYDAPNSCLYNNIAPNNLEQINDYEILKDFDNNSAVITCYLGEDTELNIPTTFNGELQNTKIGDYAFAYCLKLVTLSISEGFVEIGNHAFSGCENIKKITLPTTLKKIGSYGFSSCTSCTDFAFNEGLEHIGSAAFTWWSSMEVFRIPETVKYIGAYAFQWNTNLKEFYIPLGVESIENGALYACSKLTIYCAEPSMPATWGVTWNVSNRPIKWNYQGE